MPNYLLDTHHAVALWRNHPALKARIAAAGPGAVMHLCLPVIGEVWYRIMNMPDPTESERLLALFLAPLPVVEYDAVAAKDFGAIKTAMQKIRRPVTDVAAQVAAIARVREMTVLSAEQLFSAIPRLSVENWLG
jgi:tRNA(fMet)-specific endonuclease VapC